VGFCGDELGADTIADPERYRDVWRRAVRIHVESSALQGLAVQLGAPAGRVAVVPPVPATSPAPGEPSDQGVLRVLSVGPLTWVEGYEHAVQAIRLLVDRGVRCEYRIVGTGPFVDAVEFARHQLGLEREVTLDSETGGDVFLSAAIAPTSPKPALDAMAAGLPVVATDPIGPALSIPRRDPEAIAAALERLAADVALRRELAEEGRRHAGALGVDQQVGLYRELYSAAASVTSAASSSTVQRSASDEIRARNSSYPGSQRSA
jgi:colanic acid/amylovoran biosynthesis glycosyltransferase